MALGFVILLCCLLSGLFIHVNVLKSVLLCQFLIMVCINSGGNVHWATSKGNEK